MYELFKEYISSRRSELTCSAGKLYCQRRGKEKGLSCAEKKGFTEGLQRRYRFPFSDSPGFIFASKDGVTDYGPSPDS